MSSGAASPSSVSVRAGELGDGARDVREPGRVVAAATADDADVRAVLVRDHASTVELLLVGRAVAVERFADEGWSHRRHLSR